MYQPLTDNPYVKSPTKLSVDDVIRIFYDPKTEKRFEGKARLCERIRRLEGNPPREQWLVRFLDELYVMHKRIIKVPSKG